MTGPPVSGMPEHGSAEARDSTRRHRRRKEWSSPDLRQMRMQAAPRAPVPSAFQAKCSVLILSLSASSSRLRSVRGPVGDLRRAEGGA